MKRPIFLGCWIAALFFSFTGAAAAAEPLVDVPWLKDNLDKPNLVVLDVRSEVEYLRAHVAGALHTRFPADGWRVPGRDRIPRLPSPDAFAQMVGKLGIGNDSHVVVVSRGETVTDAANAAQIYWAFKVMGHDGVSILDGGMRAYFADESSPRMNGRNVRSARAFKANYRPHLVANVDHIRAMLNLGRGTIIDFRTHGVFLGVNKEFRVQRHGTIPGAKNFSFAWLTEDAGGRFRKPEAIRRMLAFKKISLEGTVVALSDQALLASLGWFVLSELVGYKDIRVYDTGFRDWALDLDNPVQRHFDPAAMP